MRSAILATVIVALFAGVVALAAGPSTAPAPATTVAAAASQQALVDTYCVT